MNVNFLLRLIASIIVFSFSTFVYLHNRNSKVNSSFAIFGFTITVWLFFSSLAYVYDEEMFILQLFRMSYVGIVFIPITFYHFVFNFLKKEKGRIVVKINYAIGTIFMVLICNHSYFISGLWRFPWGYYPKVSPPAHHIFDVFQYSLFYFCFNSFLRTFSRKGRFGFSSKSKN